MKIFDVKVAAGNTFTMTGSRSRKKFTVLTVHRDNTVSFIAESAIRGQRTPSSYLHEEARRLPITEFVPLVRNWVTSSAELYLHKQELEIAKRREREKRENAQLIAIPEDILVDVARGGSIEDALARLTTYNQEVTQTAVDEAVALVEEDSYSPCCHSCY